MLSNQRVDIGFDCLVDGASVNSSFNESSSFASVARKQGRLAIDFGFSKFGKRRSEGDFSILI